MLTYLQRVDDGVFRALADPSRRLLLDRLRARDGQSLGELSAELPGMTRFGVSSHLAVLESAALISAVKVGRSKLHYLNAVPLQELQRRWLTPFTAAVAGQLLDLKDHLEGETSVDTVFAIYIKASAERVWDALADTTTLRPWLHDAIMTSDLTTGSSYVIAVDGFTLITGDILETTRPTRLLMSFDPQWDDAAAAEPAGLLDYVLEESATGVTKLTVTITGLSGSSAEAAAHDTPQMYSSLKTLLETGEALP